MTRRPVAAAYIGAITTPCPSCGAPAGAYCRVHDDRRGPRTRRMPCVRRCPRGAAVDEDGAPHQHEARQETLEFSEPRRAYPPETA